MWPPLTAGDARCPPQSGKLPSDTQKFVNTVNGYAAWYEKQPAFTNSPSVTANPTDSAMKNRSDSTTRLPHSQRLTGKIGATATA